MGIEKTNACSYNSDDAWVMSIGIDAKDELLKRCNVMVIERAELPIKPGREEEFQKQFTSGVPHLRGAQGCMNISLARGIENPSKYLLFIEWETLAAHQSFTATEAFGKFVALIRPYLADKPNTEHFAPIQNQPAKGQQTDSRRRSI